MEGVLNWKLTSENQHIFNGMQEKIVCLKLSVLENPALNFALKNNANSGGYFPILTNFYLNSQGHQIWI